MATNPKKRTLDTFFKPSLKKARVSEAESQGGESLQEQVRSTTSKSPNCGQLKMGNSSNFLTTLPIPSLSRISQSLSLARWLLSHPR